MIRSFNENPVKEYTLTECERLAYIEKYGAPTRPYKPREGKEVMHLPKPAKNPKMTRKRV